MPRERPLSARRLETRSRLVGAGIEIVARDGFHGATVNAIAHRAGLSTGAVYGNFRGKDDLFLAIFEEHVKWFEDEVVRVSEAAEPVAAFEQSARLMSQDRSQFLVFIEFWAYAVRRPKLRRKLAGRLADMRAIAVSALGERLRGTKSGHDVPVETIALLGLALGRGLTLEKFIDPEAVPDELIGRVMGGLLTN